MKERRAIAYREIEEREDLKVIVVIKALLVLLGLEEKMEILAKRVNREDQVCQERRVTPEILRLSLYNIL